MMVMRRIVIVVLGVLCVDMFGSKDGGREYWVWDMVLGMMEVVVWEVEWI